jgi:CelD/BcsL family acetyltransferase involved in cellulose biosynthesis
MNELFKIEDMWRNIYETVSPNSIFISFDYIMLWYNCFARPEQVRVYPAYEGDKIIGYLPLILNKKGPFRFLSSLTNLHCFHPAALIAEGYEETFSNSCLHAIFSDKCGWDVFQYRSGYSFQYGLSLSILSPLAYHFKEIKLPTYSMLIPGSFEEYFNKHLSPQMRKNAKSSKKRLQTVPSYRFCHYTGDDAVASWPTFLSIEDSGWKGVKGSSLKKLPQNYHSYYVGLIDMLSKNNQLHMYFLEINGHPVAGTFCYVDQDVFHAWKAGYVEEFSSLSPSTLLLLYIIEDLNTNFPMVKRLHMFPGDFGYKHRYVNEESFYSEVVLYDRTILGSSAHILSPIKQRVELLPGMSAAIGFIRKHFFRDDD